MIYATAFGSFKKFFCWGELSSTPNAGLELITVKSWPGARLGNPPVFFFFLNHELDEDLGLGRWQNQDFWMGKVDDQISDRRTFVKVKALVGVLMVATWSLGPW